MKVRLTKSQALSGALFCGALACGVATAATRPEGSTAACKDGSYSEAAMKSMACKGHKGIATWYGASKAHSAAVTAPAVQTQSPKVSATGAAPTTGEPSRTPARPDAPTK